MRTFFNQHARWSQETFGSDDERGPRGPLLHLRKEVDEALAELGDRHVTVNQKALQEEIVDCLFLTLDAARRSGMSYDALVNATFDKLAVNKRRTWGPPSGDAPVEHVRSKSDGLTGVALSEEA